jgi:hypothetical protein
MQVRNPIYTSDGRIDMEIEHPVHGWIPFTADPNDPEGHGRELFAKTKAGNYGTIAAYVPPPVPPPPTLEEKRASAALSREAFMLALVEHDLYDQVEAFVAAQPKRVQVRFAHAPRFLRTDPELVTLGVMAGFTDEQMDAIFGIE